MFTQAERHRGSAHVAFCISGNFLSLENWGFADKLHIYYNEKHFFMSYNILISMFPLGFFLEGWVWFCSCSVNACSVPCLRF